MSFADAPSDPRTRTTEPIVTGGTVLGIKYRDGVMIISDTLGSYGSMARFMDTRRVHKINDTAFIGYGGDISDVQYIQDLLRELTIGDFTEDDGHSLTPKEIHSYLARVLYNRRSKVNPLWNQLAIGGFKNGQSFLGFVDLYGSAFEDNIIATGYGAYLAIPILRKKWRADLSHDEAKALLEESIAVCYYRDCRAINRFTFGTATAQGIQVSEPFSLPTKWSYKLFENPSGQMI